MKSKLEFHTSEGENITTMTHDNGFFFVVFEGVPEKISVKDGEGRLINAAINTNEFVEIMPRQVKRYRKPRIRRGGKRRG